MFEIETLTLDELERLRDACSRRILELRETKGLSLPDLLRLLDEIKVVLRDQRKEWHSLDSWQWMDGGIRFWLNPKDQEQYNPGWYTIDDLIAWAGNVGPVIHDHLFDADSEPFEDADGVPITWLPRNEHLLSA